MTPVTLGPDDPRDPLTPAGCRNSRRPRSAAFPAVEVFSRQASFAGPSTQPPLPPPGAKRQTISGGWDSRSLRGFGLTVEAVASMQQASAPGTVAGSEEEVEVAGVEAVAARHRVSLPGSARASGSDEEELSWVAPPVALAGSAPKFEVKWMRPVGDGCSVWNGWL